MAVADSTAYLQLEAPPLRLSLCNQHQVHFCSRQTIRCFTDTIRAALKRWELLHFFFRTLVTSALDCSSRKCSSHSTQSTLSADVGCRSVPYFSSRRTLVPSLQCGSITVSSTDLHFGLPEEGAQRYEERATFLRKHDARNRRLSFLYEQSASTCACNGGSEFFFVDEHGATFFNDTRALCTDDRQTTFNKCVLVWGIGRKQEPLGRLSTSTGPH